MDQRLNSHYAERLGACVADPPLPFSGSATGPVPSNFRLFRQPKIDGVD